jgi:hypothetical protein
MAGFRWPSTAQQLKIDLVRLAAIQARDSAQLRVGLQNIPCLYPCRTMPLVAFDVAQLSSLLDLFPPQREWTQQQNLSSTVESSSHDAFAACVHSVASVELSRVCSIMQQLWALINAAHDYNQGLVSVFDLLSCAHESTLTRPNIPALSILTSAGIASLRDVVAQRILPQYSALNSAANRTEAGVSLGAFSVPFRLLSVARSHSARVRNVPVESLRIRASVVATSTAAAQSAMSALPVLAVCDAVCPNALWTTNKAHDCDAFIFGSQSFESLPLAFFIDSDGNAGKSSGEVAAGGGGRGRICPIPAAASGCSRTCSRSCGVFCR